MDPMISNDSTPRLRLEAQETGADLEVSSCNINLISAVIHRPLN